MDILLVGSDRYIGEKLIDRILLEGEQVGIVGMEDFPRAYDNNSNVKLCEYDILSDDFEEVFNVFAPEVVVYYNNCQRDYKYDFTLDDVNLHVQEFLKTTQTVLDKKVKKFIYISTCTSYDTSVANPDENAPVQAHNFWEAAHIICEQHIRNISAVESTDYLILRAATVYGPGQGTKNSEVALYLESKQQNNQRYSAMSEAETDYIYIDDFVSATYKAIDSTETGVINVASGGKIETQLLHRVMDGLYLNHVIHANAFSLLKGVNVEKATKVLGFTIHTNL
ncbi:MAG: NAD(P)-dependent oxidoreductase, partial [Eubacteriales bacterium]